ncbi:MAG TPA: signal peptide peptidase SppA [Stellaceae bacterium]|nr:signal peptide peptidase SppA [Stellaceae bacterium]
MRRLFVRIFATIGFIFTFLVFAIIALLFWVKPAAVPVPQAAVLTLNLDRALSDGPASESLSGFLGEPQPSLRDVLDALERATDDPRVKGLFVRLGGDEIGAAQVQELRDAIAAFRAKGKFAIAYADSFGEFGPGNHAYYLAAACDQIWLQPQGLVGLTGLRAESPFFRGTLDKLDVVPSFDHRSEYKTAMNMITETGMTAPQREETEALLRSVFEQMIRAIAHDRKLEEAKVREIIDRGPLLTQEALDAHIVDKVGYRDQAESEARDRAGSGAELLTALAYLGRAGRPHRSGPVVAVIYGTGLIQRGGGGGPFSGSGIMGADAVARAFDQAALDPAVKAILFRIDSPGGSVVASETIWRAVLRARERGKPVVVSMGDVAGSGGYYIAAPADKIVAEPATLTGSIGVVAGKFVTAGFWKLIGVSWGSVSTSASASMFSTLDDFTPAQHARFESFLDAIYADFKDRVAKGRKMDPAAVEAVAKGRIWTGEQAKERGLVDALGGFATALALAKEAARIPADQDVTLKQVPPPETLTDVLARIASRGGDADVEAETSPGTLERMAAQLRAAILQFQLASQPPGSVAMPPVPRP